jgi:predicted HAD superfamily phosphohydrolase
VKPVGGKRKLDSLYNFSHRHDIGIGDWVVVGDSITDFQMLRGVRDSDGLAVAFNGNQYALPYATVSLVSTDVSDILQVLHVWENGDLKDVENFIRNYPADGSVNNKFDWLIDNKDLSDIIGKSRRMRRAVRDNAGGLG